MPSRLTRMLLINAKTAGLQASGGIFEVDPRGGAAITGENGVGKTTTLQLFPLFFGCAPSRIVASGGSQQAMLRFVLPTPESVIAFEYQRGASDELCFVTVRRQDGSDAPEFRFFKGAFRSDLFVHDLPDGSGLAFLNDAGTSAAADRLGVIKERKLDGSQYRAVILNVKANSKHHQELRRLARDYSFSRRSLAHMDRLVANVVKERVDFKDFITLAVFMVYEAMGGIAGVSGSGDQRLRLRQTREQIERWLLDRDASDRALKLKPEVTALDERIARFRCTGFELNAFKADVIALRRLLSRDLEQCQRVLSELKAEREEREASDAVKAKGLQDELESLNDQRSAISLTLQSLEDDASYLTKNNAQDWSSRFQSLETLKAGRAKAHAELDLAQSQVSNITVEIGTRIAELKAETAKSIAAIEEQRRKPVEEFEVVRAASLASQVDELVALTAAHDQAEAAIRVRIDEIQQRVGEFREAMRNPEVDLKLKSEYVTAATVLNRIRNELEDALHQLSDASKAERQAQSVFDERERTLAAARERQRVACAALERVRYRLKPDGTLLASLLGSANQDWRTHLARILDPQLLERTDLQFTAPFEDDPVNGIYGWNLDLDAIETPAWADDEALKRELTRLSESHEAANAQVGNVEAERVRAAHCLDKARETLSQREVAVQVLRNRRGSQDEQVEVLKKALDASIGKTRQRAQEQFEQASAQRQSEQAALEQAKRRFDQRKQEIAIFYHRQIDQQKQRQNAALAALEVQKRELEAQKEVAIARLQAERERRLVDNNVDPVHVNRLIEEIKELKHQIGDLEQRQTLVERWDDWLRSDGAGRLERARQALRLHQSSMQDVSERLRRHDSEARKAAAECASAHKARESEISSLERQKNCLDQLEVDLEGFIATQGSGDVATLMADELKGRISAKQTERRALEREIERTRDRIYNQLTSKDSAVKTLVVEHMAQAASADDTVLVQATCLQSAYNEIGRQVIANVNTSLGTLLENIGDFRNTIDRFKSQVVEFNKHLQAGLSGVSLRFERLKDFQIHVVCDFEKLDFLKKLDSLDEIIRDHRLKMAMTVINEVPPASTANALRDIMSLLGSSGSLEIDLSQHITLSGSVNDAGIIKHFRRESELTHLSSTGITAIALLTLLSGMLNVVRGDEEIFIPWVTDEVGRFDPKNFKNLMAMLRDNRIDVVTASPALTQAMYPHFSQRYIFMPGSTISVYRSSIAALEQAMTPVPKQEIRQ